VKIVLDTNIIISGLISHYSPPAQLLRAWSDGKVILLTSRLQLMELRRVFEYDHIQSRISLKQRKNILENIDAEAIVCDTLPNINVSPDTDDNVILATAIIGHADLIISGDKRHMLSLKEVEGIPILTAREALNILNLSDP